MESPISPRVVTSNKSKRRSKWPLLKKEEALAIRVFTHAVIHSIEQQGWFGGFDARDFILDGTILEWTVSSDAHPRVGHA